MKAIATKNTFFLLSSSSERFKDRAHIYVVNGDEDEEVEPDDEDESSSLADDLLKFSEKHEFEVNIFFIVLISISFVLTLFLRCFSQPLVRNYISYLLSLFPLKAYFLSFPHNHSFRIFVVGSVLHISLSSSL